MDSHQNIEPVVVYVQLLDEGTYTYRPTSAEPIRGKIYRLLPTVGYDPEDETWEFAPGSLVECEKQRLKVGDVLLAVKLAYDGDENDLTV